MNPREDRSLNFLVKIKSISHLLLLPIFWGVLLLIGFLFDPGFLSAWNLSGIMSIAPIYGVLAIGQGILIIGGRIDISQGAVASFSTLVLAWVAQSFKFFDGFTLTIIAVLTALGVGLAIGFFNGILSEKGKIPPIIATLISMMIVTTFAFVIFSGEEQWVPLSGLSLLNEGVIPLSLLIFIGLLIVAYVVLTRTPFGRGVYAMGGDEEAAYANGIKVNRHSYIVFLISAVLAAFAGVLLAAQCGAADEELAHGYLFISIAIIVLGGIRLEGGSGNILTIFFGSLIIASISSLLVMMNVTAYAGDIITAIIILIAALIALRR